MDTTAAKIEKTEHYTFELAENVARTKVTFRNHFGIELVGDLYAPKDSLRQVQGDSGAKYAALAISGPFGAIKEQASGFYANQMASRGFIALAFDPSYTGESGGEPRYINSPDINTEDFMAAVDYLSTRDNIDPEKIGIIGICGWGGMAINTAAIDTRIKATVASTMYDLSRTAIDGYFDEGKNEDAHYAVRKSMSDIRTEDFRNGTYTLSGGVVDPLPADAPYFVKDYYDYYKTPRGYHERSLNSNGGWAVQSLASLANTHLMAYADEIRSAVMVLHGEKAHSRYMGEDAFKRLTGDNKELVIIPGASHTDLYDGGKNNAIPFDRLAGFFNKYLK